MSRRLNSKKSVGTDVSLIDNFPKLNIEEIQNDILFGSFQLRQSQSYVIDIIKNGKAYIIEEDQIKSRKKNTNVVSKCKVIGFEIASRHKRSELKDNKKNAKKFRKNYKVFIKYLPHENNPKAIKGILVLFKL